MSITKPGDIKIVRFLKAFFFDRCRCGLLCAGLGAVIVCPPIFVHDLGLSSI